MNKSTIVRIVRPLAMLGSSVAPAASASLLVRLFCTPDRHPRPPREGQWLDSASRGQVFLADGLRIPTYTWGEGPAVLLVHGWSGRGTQLGAYAQPLVDAGFKVVAFDAPAHGEAEGAQTALPVFATAIARVAESVGPLQAVVAHSLGAAATSYALSQGVSARRVVYLAPPEDPRNYLASLASQLGFSDAVMDRSTGVIAARYGVAITSLRGRQLGPKQTAELVVFHDRDDREVPASEGERVASTWPGAHFVPVSGLGHRRIVRDPAVVAAAVDFLTRPQAATLDYSESLRSAER